MGQNLAGFWGEGRAIVWLPYSQVAASSQDSSASPWCPVPLFSLALVSFALQKESAISRLPLRMDLSDCVHTPPPQSLRKTENNFRTQSAGGLWSLR